MHKGGGKDTALRTRDPTHQLNLVGRNEEDLSNLLSPNSPVSAASGRLSQHPSIPDAQQILPQRASTTDVQESIKRPSQRHSVRRFC